MQQLYKRLGASVKEYHVFDGFFHDILGEKDRHLPLTKAREFIEKQFETAINYPDLSQADQKGFTFDEADNLKEPLSKLSLKYWYFAATRANIGFASKSSTGLKLGIETGFDSGNTLDYVYQNQRAAQAFLGVLPIARI